MKLEPPFRLEGRAVIRGKNGERLEIESATVSGIDSDGYIRLNDVRSIRRNRNAEIPQGKNIGTIAAKIR